MFSSPAGVFWRLDVSTQNTLAPFNWLMFSEHLCVSGPPDAVDGKHASKSAILEGQPMKEALECDYDAPSRLLPPLTVVA